MIFRQATREDVLKVSRLWVAMVKELSPESRPDLNAWRASVSLNMTAWNYSMFLAEDGGKVVGFVDYFLVPEPMDSQMHVLGRHIYVTREYRNSKVPGKLWKTAIKTAQQRGGKILDLLCAPEQQRFWERHGFKPAFTLMSKGE